MFNFLKALRCSHFNTQWKFAGYHTAYRTVSSNTFNAVHIRETGHCHECGKNFSRHAIAPPKLSKLFFANFQECMAEDPAVIANLKKEVEKERINNG